MLSQNGIQDDTPMGGTLLPGGATFRVWAPRAHEVHVLGDFNAWAPSPDSLMLKRANGHWTGFVPALREGDAYKLWVRGVGSVGFKRDPRARELSSQPAFPNANCILRDPARFAWHETAFQPPAFSNLVIYQCHVGTFSIPDGKLNGKFLDVADRLPYLASLGVNAIEPLPVDEFPTQFSMGYNGTDPYSPENDYAEADPIRLEAYLQRINALLASQGLAPYSLADITGARAQLKALIDLCHIHGIAVFLDLVYNHAGGDFDEESIWFFDRVSKGNNNDSLYFTDQGWAGGLIYAYWNQDVRQFLIDNATYFVSEYRIDGFRFDEVSVMDRFGGWSTCQAMTDMLHRRKPNAALIAEYWPVNQAVLRATGDGGAGFDMTWHDGLREAVRAAISDASGGRSASVDMDRVGANLYPPGMPAAWRGVNCIENHDIIKVGAGQRVARLADQSSSRSWYARSRARVAMGLLLSAPGVPMLFMGQEFLEDKQWSDDPNAPNLIYWNGLDSDDKTMADFLRFTRELIAFRHSEPALKSERINVFHVHNQNRILAFHRWLDNVGRDVVVVVNLQEYTYYHYRVGFPGSGFWREAFNSDVYDNWVNPRVAGNGGGIYADDQSTHGLPAGATITIPANAVVLFVR